MHTPSVFDYQAIFMNAPVGMCVAVDRTIVSCNHALAAMFAYDPAALHDCSLSVLYPTMDEFMRTGGRVLTVLGRTGRYSDERIMRRRDGDLFWCHVTGCALVDADTQAPTIWTFEDVSTTRPVTARLTPREREIAAFLVEGKTSKVIARAVNLSPRTVEMHRARMMKKFSASTALELAYRLAGSAPRPE